MKGKSIVQLVLLGVVWFGLCGAENKTSSFKTIESDSLERELEKRLGNAYSSNAPKCADCITQGVKLSGYVAIEDIVNICAKRCDSQHPFTDENKQSETAKPATNNNGTSNFQGWTFPAITDTTKVPPTTDTKSGNYSTCCDKKPAEDGGGVVITQTGGGSGTVPVDVKSVDSITGSGTTTTGGGAVGGQCQITVVANMSTNVVPSSPCAFADVAASGLDIFNNNIAAPARVDFLAFGGCAMITGPSVTSLSLLLGSSAIAVPNFNILCGGVNKCFRIVLQRPDGLGGLLITQQPQAC